MTENTPQKPRKPISFRPPEVILQMIDDIQTLKGYEGMSAVLYQAIREMHARSFPAYATTGKKIARRNEDEEEHPNMAIARKLGGAIVERDSGPACVYYNFHKSHAYRQEVPLDALTDAMIRNQYSPSKLKVEELRAKGKTDYDLKELDFS